MRGPRRHDSSASLPGLGAAPYDSRPNEGGRSCPAPSPRFPKGARRSRFPAGSSRFPTTRSSRSSRATAPARHLARVACASSTRPSRRPTAASARSRWMEVYAGQKAFDQPPDLAPRRDARRLPRIPRRHQGPAHDADRRRHPLAERRAAPAARPLRLPPPRALVPGRAVARQAPRRRSNMVIFRENTEDIYAGIEFEAGTEDAKKFARVPEGRTSPRSTRRSASPRRPASASSPSRRRAASASSARRSITRSPTRARASRSSTRATS